MKGRVVAVVLGVSVLFVGCGEEESQEEVQEESQASLREESDPGANELSDVLDLSLYEGITDEQLVEELVG